MKNARIILVLLLALAVRPAAAQPVVSAYFVNSSLYDTKSAAQGGFSGFQGDLMWHFAFNRFLGVNLGGGYLWLNRSEEPFVLNDRAAERYTREQHIRIPMHFIIDIPITQGFGFQLWLGGVGSAAISGVNVLSFRTTSGTGLVQHDYYSGIDGRKGVTDEEHAMAVPSLSKSPDMKRFDLAAEAGVGIRISSFVMVRGGYTYGVFNRYKKAQDGFVRRNQINAGITLLF